MSLFRALAPQTHSHCICTNKKSGCIQMVSVQIQNKGLGKGQQKCIYFFISNCHYLLTSLQCCLVCLLKKIRYFEKLFSERQRVLFWYWLSLYGKTKTTTTTTKLLCSAEETLSLGRGNNARMFVFGRSIPFVYKDQKRCPKCSCIGSNIVQWISVSWSHNNSNKHLQTALQSYVQYLELL